MKNFLSFILLFLTASGFCHEIAVVTLAVGAQYKQAVYLGIENKRAYCEQHGYDFICFEEQLDSSRPIPWSKIKALQKVMENPQYKWVFWTDADSLIMNQAICLEDLIDEKYHFILAKDRYEINTGEFLLKNCEWSRQLLNNVYDHTECINDRWWEQQAFINELASHPEHWDEIKIIPQRMLNSYYFEEFADTLCSVYQKGDFIIHFASVHDLRQLRGLMQKYSEEVVNDRKLIDISYYLGLFGFQLTPVHGSNNEGYMTDSQKQQFREQLLSYSNVKSVLEIGLNGGHSSENFFQCCPQLERLLSFDICHHAYTQPAVEYFERFHKKEFKFVKGDSRFKVREYATDHPTEKFDLIYIDGNHEYQFCLQDLLNCRALAHSGTILWVDDYNSPEVQKAIGECAEQGILSVDQEYQSFDPYGDRCWVKAHYLFK